MPDSQLLPFTGCNRPARSSRSWSAVQRFCWSGTFRQRFNHEFRRGLRPYQRHPRVRAANTLTEVQRLSWEQYLAGEPCRGCGRPMTDATLWSGSGKGLIHLSEEERAQYDSEEQHFKVRHADCDAHRWTVGGSLTTHCGKCCPPPPMSPEQTARIATLLHQALRDQQGLKGRK